MGRRHWLIVLLCALLLTVGCSRGGVTVSDLPDSSIGDDSGSDAPPVSEAPNIPPTAFISNPAGGSEFFEAEAVSFTGSGTDVEDGSLSGESLVWVSGAVVIGTGASIQESFTVGEHTVTLLAKDSDGATSSASVSITVNPQNQAPSSIAVTINGTSPVDSYSGPIVLNGTAADSDGVLNGTSYVWAINGPAGSSYDYETFTTPAVTLNNLPVGNYEATLTVTDSGGLTTASDPIAFTVTGTNPVVEVPPVVSISSPGDNAALNGDTVVLYGTGTDATGSTVPNDSLSWTVTDNSTGAVIVNSEDGASLTVDDLPVGTYTVTLTATDSSGTVVSTDTTTITVVNTSPTATITGPLSGSGYIVGTSIAFTGTCSDADPNDSCTLVWSSSINGPFGAGESSSYSGLSVGTHTITLTATDTHQAQGTDTITVKVMRNNTAPTASITSPADGSSFTQGVSISFSGTGSDAEGDSLTYVWSADGEPIGTGSSFTRSDLSQGSHVISLSASDSVGATGTASITITITANGSPTVVISSPSEGDIFEEGQTVTFSGDASDSDGIGAIFWTDSGSVIGSGASFTKSDLSVGSHTIAMIAVDVLGAASSTTVTITVKLPNQPPVVSISSPADRSVFYAGETINFSGSATDPEGDTVTVSWSSSIDGDMGSSTTATLANPAAGTRTITLTATDSNGRSGTKSIVVSVVNNPAGYAFYEDFSADPNYTSGRWTIYRNNGSSDREARYRASDGWLYLTTSGENVFLGTAMFAGYDLSITRWQADFDYNAEVVSGGDGFVFMFYKDKSCYQSSKPAIGGNMGFVCEDNTGSNGYGLEFDWVNNSDENYPVPHIALIKDHPLSSANHLSFVGNPKNDGRWHHITVVFDGGRVKVYIDDANMSNTPLIDFTISDPIYTYQGIGFGAGSGSVTNNHVIDNFTLKAL